MVIPFPSSGSAIIVSQLTASFNQLTINSYNDYPSQKIMAVDTSEIGRILVYTGSAYDENVNWTKNDVSASLISRFSL